MQPSIKYEGDDLVIRNGERITFSTADRLVAFLTTEQTFSANAVFPDVLKGEGYIFQYDVDYDGSGGGSYAYTFSNASTVLARPSEWHNQIVLGAVPPGANLFLGRATINRTVGPSHAWGDQSMVMRCPENKATQITGSFLLEQVKGLSRRLTFKQVDGNLVVDMKQSCGPVSGNFVAWGTHLAPSTDAIGGDNSAPSGAGKYVHTAHPGYTGRGTVNRFSVTGPIPVPNLSDIAATYRNGGTYEAPYSDATDYGSTYSLLIKGRFGRVFS